MNINMSPSEIGLICKALSNEMLNYPLQSHIRDDYVTIMDNLCDTVAQYYRECGHDEDFFYEWLDDNDLVTPF